MVSESLESVVKEETFYHVYWDGTFIDLYTIQGGNVLNLNGQIAAPQISDAVKAYAKDPGTCRTGITVRAEKYYIYDDGKSKGLYRLEDGKVVNAQGQQAAESIAKLIKNYIQKNN